MLHDQTSAHDPLNGYLPVGWTMAQAESRRQQSEKDVVDAAKASMAKQVQAMLTFKLAVLQP